MENSNSSNNLEELEVNGSNELENNNANSNKIKLVKSNSYFLKQFILWNSYINFNKHFYNIFLTDQYNNMKVFNNQLFNDLLFELRIVDTALSTVVPTIFVTSQFLFDRKQFFMNQNRTFMTSFMAIQMFRVLFDQTNIFMSQERQLIINSYQDSIFNVKQKDLIKFSESDRFNLIKKD